MSTGSECELVCVFLCPVPRSLCVDALIELSDENADWKLSFDEFLNCLKPGFNPPEKSELPDTWPLTQWLYDDNTAHHCWHHTCFFSQFISQIPLYQPLRHMQSTYSMCLQCMGCTYVNQNSKFIHHNHRQIHCNSPKHTWNALQQKHLNVIYLQTTVFFLGLLYCTKLIRSCVLMM